MYVHVLWSTLCVLACDFFFLFHLGREKGRRRGSFMEEKKVENEGGRISYDGSATLLPTEEWAFFSFSIAFTLSRPLLTCLIRWIRWGRPFWPWPLFFKKDRCKKKAKKRKEDRGREKGGKNLRESIWMGTAVVLWVYQHPVLLFTSADGYKY